MKNIYLHKVILFLYFVTSVACAEESETLSTAYLLSPVDKLTISVYGQPDLQSEQRISDAGTVSIPLLGEIIIGGLTVSETQRKIEAALISERYLVRPVVTISIEEFSPKVVTVLGEVESPGSIKIPDGRNGLSVQVAIAEAGGFTSAANKNEVQLQRAVKNDQSTNEKSITVNVNELLLSKSIKTIIVRPGDIIYVQRRLF